jgi:hypothetical protein
MARELENVRYFKIEMPQTAAKLRELIALGGDGDRRSVGRRGGDHLDGRPRRRRHRRDDRRRLSRRHPQIMDAYFAGRREEAVAAYARWLPLINYENRQGGFLAAKALMKEGGVIACDAPRCPYPAMNPACSTPRAIRCCSR